MNISIDLPPEYVELYTLPEYAELYHLPKYESIFPQHTIIIQPTIREVDFSIPEIDERDYLGCYNKNSVDMRCCGICALFPSEEDSYGCCPLNLVEYCDIYTNQLDILSSDCCICIFPFICIPLSLCFFGTLFNQCINYIRDTHNNYLF